MSAATVEVVADTNIVIWYFLEPAKLTAATRDALKALVATAEMLGARLVSADRTLPAMTSTTVIW